LLSDGRPDWENPASDWDTNWGSANWIKYIQADLRYGVEFLHSGAVNTLFIDGHCQTINEAQANDIATDVANRDNFN
jgi:prepilin-type processing-associated H-X9-DG protein